MQLKQRRGKSKEQQDPEAIRSVRGEVVHRRRKPWSGAKPASASESAAVASPKAGGEKRRRTRGKAATSATPPKTEAKRPVVGPRTEQRDRMHPRHQRLEVLQHTELQVAKAAPKPAAKPTAKPAAKTSPKPAAKPAASPSTASIS